MFANKIILAYLQTLTHPFVRCNAAANISYTFLILYHQGAVAVNQLRNTFKRLSARLSQ